MKTIVIAEVGVNHNGSVDMAKALVRKAASAGADLVKFQTFSASKLVTRSAPTAAYQSLNTSMNTQYEMIQNLELSRRDHEELIQECRACGVGFLSTAFDCDSLAMLEELRCLEWIKVPSGEITNLPLLRMMGGLGKKILLSTGMADLGEIEDAICTLERAGTDRTRMVVLHCTTEYPTPMPDVNLRAMSAMRTAFGVDVGYSDHTAGIEVAIAAVALGAVVVEKHVTLDRQLPGPDHRASIEPEELAAMVGGIRNIERALGDGVKRPCRGEIENRVAARRSIVAARTIACGEIFTSENLTTKRPGSGISPMRWDDVVGRVAMRAFNVDEPIQV
jgi:N,N'-diacetyllegionaminate synthase